MVKIKVFRVCEELKKGYIHRKISSEMERNINSFMENEVKSVKKVLQSESINENESCLTITFFYDPRD